MTLLETVVDANRDYLVLEKGEGGFLFRLSNAKGRENFVTLSTVYPIERIYVIIVRNAKNSKASYKLIKNADL